MKILVTGGCGFIGSNFVRYWLAHHPHDTLVVLDALTYAGNKENLSGIIDQIQFVHGSICDESLARSLMKDTDLVVHFAAETHVDRSISGPDAFVQTNIVGTYTLLKAARERMIRFHHISTDEVFGQIALDSQERWSTDSPYQPRSPYAASKAASDHMVRAFGITYGLPVTISNCANNYGPYLYPEKLLALAITNILEGKKVPIYGHGNQIREWLFVQDHCSAIDLIVTKGAIGETYIIAPTEPHITNLEIITKVIQMMGGDDSSIEFVQDRPGHDQKYSLDPEKIIRELGWQQEHSLGNGLEIMIDWYRTHESWWKKIKSGEFAEYYKKQYSQ